MRLNDDECTLDVYDGINRDEIVYKWRSVIVIGYYRIIFISLYEQIVHVIGAIITVMYVRVCFGEYASRRISDD